MNFRCVYRGESIDYVDIECVEDMVPKWKKMKTLDNHRESNDIILAEYTKSTSRGLHESLSLKLFPMKRSYCIHISITG